MWCPGSGVVLDCIDSSSLPSFLLYVKDQLQIFLKSTLLLQMGYPLSGFDGGCSYLAQRLLMVCRLQQKVKCYLTHDECAFPVVVFYA